MSSSVIEVFLVAFIEIGDLEAIPPSRFMLFMACKYQGPVELVVHPEGEVREALGMPHYSSQQRSARTLATGHQNRIREFVKTLQ